MQSLSHDIEYRLMRSVDEMRQMVELQRLVWGEEPETLISLSMLFSLASSGCPLIGAFDGNLLVGFSIAFYGTDVQDSKRPALANLKLASKRLAVHPDYRSAGIGLQLKLEQKKFAHQQGIRLITWTFDPLISRNAFFHIHKLGAIGRGFRQDYYDGIAGQTDSIGVSDRLLCEWWITSNRVEERLHGSRRDLTVEQYIAGNSPIINPAILAPNGLLMPYEGSAILGDHHLLLVEIPPDSKQFFDDPSLLMSWRNHTRSVFMQTFAAGYIVTDFLHEEYEGRERSFYVMGFDGTGRG